MENMQSLLWILQVVMLFKHVLSMILALLTASLTF